MDIALRGFLNELAELSRWNVARATDQAKHALNITPDTDELLPTPILVTGARRILDLGILNGFSTIWLAADFGE